MVRILLKATTLPECMRSGPVLLVVVQIADSLTGLIAALAVQLQAILELREDVLNLLLRERLADVDVFGPQLEDVICGDAVIFL